MMTTTAAKVRIPFVLRVGDGRTGFSLDRVNCEYVDHQFELPPDLHHSAGGLVAEFQKRVGFDLTDEPGYRLIGADLQSPGDGRPPHLKLALERTRYFDYVATNLSLDCHAPGATNGRLRASSIQDIARFEETPLANILSVMLLLVSEPDGIAVFARRSERVASDPGRLQVSAGGSMRLAIDRDEALSPSPFVTAQRELAEELGVRLPLESIEFLGLGVDTRTGEPELLGLGTTALPIRQLRQAFEAARLGNEELSELETIPFTIDDLAPLLAEQRWCPGDWVCTYLALAHRHGTDALAERLTWESCRGVPLVEEPYALQPGAPPDDGLRGTLRTWRKQAPLRVRQFYGWGRRLVVPHYLWTHPEFDRYRALLQRTEKMSLPDLEAMQIESLRALLQHAYEHVPYYRRVFDERAFRPQDVTALTDLRKLPLLRRRDVRANLCDLVARNVSADRLYYVMTGGTTGEPLGFYHEKDVTRPHEAAFMYRQWSWAGYRLGDRAALLRPYTFAHRRPDGQPSWWDYCAYDNSLLLSNYLMSAETLPLYVDKLREFNPLYLQSFPSALYVLARYVRRAGPSRIKPRAIFTEFEQLYPEQRALIEETFDCPVLAGYGHSERAVDAVECLERSGYHIGMEYGVVELVDADGRPVPPGEPGFVVGTGLDTHCMPFIRYLTDDVARLVDGPCACGRAFPRLGDLVGRWQHEVVVTRDGRRIPVTTLNTHGDAFERVEQYQFFQDAPGELVVRLIPQPGYSEADTARIQGALLAKLHGAMHVQIVFVDKIERTPRGKHRLLVQALPVTLDPDGQEGTGEPKP